MQYKICMIGPDITVKGGISSVVKGYLNSSLVEEYSVKYISSHIDGNKVKKFIKAICAYYKFIKVCLKEKPNIVHIHSSFGASFYRKSIFIFISNLFNIPILNHIHGAEFDLFYEKAGAFKKKLIKNIYSKQDLTIVLSEEWKRLFRQIIDENKIFVLENFAPNIKNVYKLNDRDNYILFLGEVGKRKGAYDIPEVVERVSKVRNDIKFLICGNGDTDKLKEILIKKGIEQYVDFKGWIGTEDKIKLLNSSRIFFLPTYNEGLPMSILEAMSYGLPIISTDVGGIPTLVRDGENGFIFKPGSVDEYAKSILKILEDHSLSIRMFNANREKIKKYYSLENNLSKVREIYHRYIGEE